MTKMKGQFAECVIMLSKQQSGTDLHLDLSSATYCLHVWSAGSRPRRLLAGGREWVTGLGSVGGTA